jgi:hypothetical protein
VVVAAQVLLEEEVVFIGQAAARLVKNERTETALMEFILKRERWKWLTREDEDARCWWEKKDMIAGWGWLLIYHSPLTWKADLSFFWANIPLVNPDLQPNLRIDKI